MDKKFIDTIIAARGTRGKQLLDRIPEIIKKYEALWYIKVLPPFSLFLNYVAPAVSLDGIPLVFKIGLHGLKEFRAEHDAFQLFNGEGVVKLISSNIEDTVMLLERVEPGIPVSKIENDDKATYAILSVMKRLWKPISDVGEFPTLQDWYKGFERLRKIYNGTTGPLPEKLVKEGEELYRYLIETSTEQYLLHGDLHHDNVLSSTRGKWLAIDPDVVIGERAHDTAAMLRNPSSLSKQSNIKSILSRRIAILSEELGLDKERIRQWGIAQNILSMIWEVEDRRKGWSKLLRIVQTLSDLRTK